MFHIKWLLALAWLNPWLAFTSLTSQRHIPATIDLASSVVCALAASMALVTLSVGRIDSAVVYAAAAMLAVSRSRGVDNSSTLYYKAGTAYIYAGLIAAAAIKIYVGGRVGLFGGEPNFSTVPIWLYSLILLRRKYFKTIFILVCIGAWLTTSKIYVFTMAMTAGLFYFRKSKTAVAMLAIVICSVVYVVTFLDIAESTLVTALSSGYTEDISRIFYVFDSSFAERRGLVWGWMEGLSNEPTLIVGVFEPLQVEGLIVVHNSFLQQAASRGIYLVIILLFLAFRDLPMWLLPPYLFMSFFLHNVLSVAVLFVITSIWNEEVRKTKLVTLETPQRRAKEH